MQPLPLGFRTTYAYRIVSTEAASNLPRVRAFHEWLCSEVAKSLVKVGASPCPPPRIGRGNHTAIRCSCKCQSGLHQVKEKIANQQYGTHD